MPKPKKYNRGIIRRTPTGKYLAEVNCQFKRHRKTFPSEPQARAWIDATVTELDNANRPLNAFELREARKAFSLLPAGVSLLEAVNSFLANQDNINQVPLAEAIREYLEEKEYSGLRRRSLQSLRSHLNRLVPSLGKTNVSEITGSQLIRFLNDIGAQGTTRNNYRRDFKGFFTWAIKMNYALRNPAEAITLSTVEQKLPGILTVPQARNLMTAAKDTPLSGYFALALFAGLRSAEIRRLRWEAIGQYIHIGPDVAKTKRQRYVTITPNLKKWIQKNKKRGPVLNLSDRKYREWFMKIRQDAGIDTWPQNAARHSYATYHLALYQDAPKTAYELGHTAPTTLYEYYRNLATLKQAKEYFKIIPKS